MTADPTPTPSPVVDAAVVWAAALPTAVAGNELAAGVVDDMERHLREMHPEAMATYEAARHAGLDRADAMLVAAPVFDTPTAGTLRHVTAELAAYDPLPGLDQAATRPASPAPYRAPEPPAPKPSKRLVPRRPR